MVLKHLAEEGKKSLYIIDYTMFRHQAETTLFNDNYSHKFMFMFQRKCLHFEIQFVAKKMEENLHT